MKTYSYSFSLGIFIILALVAALVFTPLAYAEDADTGDTATDVASDTETDPAPPPVRRAQKRAQKASERAQQIRQENQDRLEAFRENQQEKRDAQLERINERKDEARERFAERRKTNARHIIGRFNHAIERMTDISNRFDERIQIVEERGVDTGNAADLVDQAQEEIRMAHDLVDQAESMIPGYEGTSEEERDVEEWRALVREAKDHLVAARELLHDAVETLRKAVQAHIETQSDASDDEA